MAGPWEQYAEPKSSAAPWEQYQGTELDDRSRKLPEGVTPSSVSGGRGVVNRPLSLADALPAGQPDAAMQFGDASGGGDGAAIMAAAQPQRTSVLEGLQIPEPQFDPAEGLRLSDRATAQATPIPGSPRRPQQTIQASGIPEAPGLATQRGQALQDAALPVRATFKAVSGVAQGAGGLMRAAGDMTGINTLSRAGAETAKGAEQFEQGMGQQGAVDGFGPKSPVPYLSRMAEGAASSLGQSAAYGGMFGAKAVIPIMSVMTAGQEYDKARNAGLDPAMALAGALPKGAFEAIGEKFSGMDKAVSAMGTLLTKGATAESKKSAAAALLQSGIKEVPGEVVTYLGQSATDLLPGIGLNPNMTMGQFVDGLRDTVVQSAMMGGAMGGAAAALQPKAAAQDQRIKKLRDAGEDEAAKMLESRQTAASVGSEISAMGDAAAHPAFQDAYRTQRTQGLKPAEAAARAGILTGFGELASTAGLNEKAVKAASDAAAKMPLDKVPGFLEKFVTSLTAKGMGQALPPGAVAETLSAVRDDAMTAAMDSIYADTPAATMDAITALENEQNQPIAQSQQAQPAIQNVAIDGVNDEAQAVTDQATQIDALPAEVATGNESQSSGDSALLETDSPQLSQDALRIQNTPSGDVGKIFGQLKSGDATAVLFEKALEALKSGKSTISGVKDPILTRAKSAFDQGLIKTPEDIRNFEANGYPQPGEWAAFDPSTGTKGVPRAEMPQIKSVHRGAMVNFLNARGITHEEVEVDPASLKPTQAEYSPEKVRKAMGFTDGDRSILISSDGHVLDGHHQWLAKAEGGQPVRAIRLNAPIDQLLQTVSEFPSATTSSASEVTQNVQNPPPAAPDQQASAAETAPTQAVDAGAAAAAGQDAAGAKAGTGAVQADGVVGAKYAQGDTPKTASGRLTTPFPKINFDTNRKGGNTIKAVDKWLMQNALDEANSRGDTFNARQFESALEKPQQADKDSAEEYLFGEYQPPVPRPFLRPLVSPAAPAAGVVAAKQSLGDAKQESGQTAKSLPAPTKQATLKAKIAKNQADRAAYFTPGNIVKSYSGHDEVISYTPPNDKGGDWSVKVRAVVQKNGKWVPDPSNPRERTHSTPPEKKNLNDGPVQVQRAQAAIESVAKPTEDTSQDPAAQRAQAAKAEQTRKAKAARLREYTYAKSPFLAFLGKHGISPKQRPDLSPDKNPLLSGYGPMFRTTGKNTDLLVQNAIEEHFLPEGATSDDLEALIRQQIGSMGTKQAQRIEAVYSPDVADRVMTERMNSYQEELAGQQEAAQNEDFDPFAPLGELEYTQQDADASGYSNADQALQLEVNALLLTAEKQGIDTDEIKEQAYDSTREGTTQDYLEASRAALQAAIQGSNGDSGQDVGQPVNAAKQDELATPTFDATQRADGTLAVKGDTAAIREALTDIPAKSIISTPGGVLVGKTQADKAMAILQPADLTAPTKADVLAQQQAKTDGEKANASQRKAEQERLRREAERRDIAKASEAAAATFELGGDAEQNLSGQQGMFDAPAPKSEPKAKANTIFTEDAANAARARLLAKRGRLGSGIDPEMLLDGITLAGYHIERGARTFSAYAKAMLADLGDEYKPYLKSWYMGVKFDPRAATFDGMDSSAKVEEFDLQPLKADNSTKENSDVPSTNGRVERNSEEPTAEPAVGDIVQDEARGTTAGTGNTGGQAGRGDGSGQSNGAGVSPGSATSDRERSDQLVRGGRESPGPAGSDARTDFGERSGDSGITGIPPDAIPAGEVKAASTNGDADAAQRSKQRAASSLSVKPGDLQNVRDTLPYLLPAQQEDVHKAETVFSRPNGYGMLFTNGTGTGKTFTGLGIVKRFAMQGKDNTLIVVPDNKIASDWIKSGKALGLDITQLEDTTQSGKGIVLTTYANLGANDSLAKRQWDLVIPDEAHSLMQAADGVVTSALQNLRAITHHQDGALQRYTMQNRPDIDRFAELDREIVANNKIINKDDTMDVMRQSLQAANEKLEKEQAPLRIKLQKARDAVNAEVSNMQGAKRTRLAFLSATPFAYEKTVDWASGYLFDYMDGYPYDPLRAGLNYNQPDPFQYFMMTRFGYTMRTNKLNQPGPKVDSGLMQRQFNAELKKKGVLSGRMLDVKPDYDRRFVLVNSSIGNTIDEALEWLTEQAREESKVQIANKSDIESPNGMNTLASAIKGQFDYLSRRYLLEAIKAQEVVPIVKQHLALGRKVVVFHDYNKGGSTNPFAVPQRTSSTDNTNEGRAKAANFNKALAQFNAAFPQLVTGLNDLLSPIEVFKKELPQTMLINGKEKVKDLLARYLSFQDDANGPQVMLVQSDKNKGWSGHDTTGKHQRVLINLGQPTAPTKAIQQEGRIYRTGQASDAIMRYLNTGTSWERWAFATTIATRSSTAENLGMGEQARALKDSFVAAFEESDTFAPGHEGEGTGGKARDKASNAVITEYDRARSFYFATAKKNSKTKAQEGVDYFATPEPVGLKMVQWLDARPGEDLLEPSGGHGAIARWMPEKAQKTVIEPSANLRSRMALVLDMESTKMLDGTFEELNVVNKFDGIAMNPPFGTAGKTAIDHLAKAATHLRDGGRIVALIPTGPATDKKFDNWFYETTDKPIKPVATHPTLGDIFKGDTLSIKGYESAEWIVESARNGFVQIKTKSGVGTSEPLNDRIAAIKPTGKQKESRRPKGTEDLYMVADIKLPQVTFERAGTAVATRIVVIEKHANESEALKQAASRMDFSGIDDINELFDRLENVALPDRPKAKQAEEADEPAKPARKPPSPNTSAPPKAAAQIGDTVQIMGKDYTVSTYTTNAGKELRGVWVPTRAIALFHGPSTFEKKGKGFFVRERDFPKPSTADAPKFSRSQSQSEGISRADFNAAIAEAFGAKVAQRLLDNKVVIPLEDQTQLPGHVVPFLRDGDVVYGFYDRRTNATYAVLSNLQPNQIKGLVLHEVGVHFGFKNMLGQDKYDQVMKRLEVMRKMGSKAVRTAYANAVENSSKPEHVPEETLAYMMNSTPELGIVQEVVAKIKAFLFRTFGIGGSKLEYADLVMLARAAVRHSSIGKPGGGGVPLFNRSTDQPQTDAFKRWFGDSKVVDADGKPLVVYHDTKSNADNKIPDSGISSFRTPTWFKASPEAYFGVSTTPDGEQQYPAYISLKNALITTDYDLASEGVYDGWKELNGYDGVILKSESGEILHVVAFDPKQIKSATGNNGDFDPENPDIRFSRTIPTPGPGLFQPVMWDTPDPSKIDRLIYEGQDSKVDLKRVQQAITKSGQTIKEEFDARLAETLYPKRVAYRSQNFLETEVKPLLDAMVRNKVEMNELADYLHARGAEERNKQIAKVNPKMPDGGAGTNTKGELMTTQAARDYLANISPLRKMVLDAMAKRVDAITADTRKLLVTEGLEKQETIDAWEAVYKNYVPMFRDEAESAMPPHPQGSGFTIKGSSSKRATGSTKEVTNILAHVLMQREAAITRGEKNRVAMSLYGQALSHPNPEFWTTIRPGMSNAQIGDELNSMGIDPMTAEVGMERAPTIRSIDPNTGKVVDRTNPMYKNLPGAITLRIKGEDRVLMLNTKLERGQRLAESLKNMDGLSAIDYSVGVLHKYVWSTIPAKVGVGPATRWLAAVNTQYNPAFGLVNLTRDALGGAVNLGSTELRGNALKVLMQSPASAYGIARELASGGQSGKWQALYRQFQADGGKTGFKELFRDPNDRAKAIEKELKDFGRSKWSPGQAVHALLDLLDGFNTTLENAVRLSAYSAALDKGMSRPRAAQLATELTVDFNRKGRLGREVGPLYAFFNAAVQGNARTIETLKGPTGRKIIMGGLGLGVLQALMLAFAGYDDDEIPEYVKARTLVIPLNLTGKGEKEHILIPLPLGLHVLPNTGRVLAELALSGGKDAGKRSFNAIGEIAGSFSPLSGGNIFTADGALKTIAPTLLDPVIELSANKNFAGNRIEKESYGGEADNRPGVNRVKESTQRTATGQAYMGISKAINSMTGGTDYEAGLFSPTPEMARYVAQTVGGGVLREIEKTINASVAKANGQDVKSSQIPVLGRFYGEVDDDRVQTSRYYETAKKIRQAESSIKAASSAGDFEAADKIAASRPEVDVQALFKKVQKNLSALNKEAVQVVENPAEMKLIDQDRVELMRLLNLELADLEKASGVAPLKDKVRELNPLAN